MHLICLALGGALGTLARYGLSGWILSLSDPRFPWGTLAVNLLGSLALGFTVRATEFAPLAPELRGLLTVGFCGAFTTFSTLSYETVTLAQDGAWTRAALYAFGSLGIGIAAMLAGSSLGTLVSRFAGLVPAG
ncbi:MAG TPA: fluoride efflux transporter CrcB [Longimicrobiales bacterium]